MALFAIPFPQIDPALFTLDLGVIEFSLRWYALAYIFGLVGGWRMLVWLVRRPGLWPANTSPMQPHQPEELLTWMTLGVVLGGRLGFVLFYNLPYYMAHPVEIFQVWHGGMSFHGGFAGVILGLVFYTRRQGIPLLQAADGIAMVAPFGLFLGRIANFINGELWGRPSDVPWAMVFPNAGPEPRHPSQLYEAGLEGLLLFAIIWFLGLRQKWLRRPGALTGVFFLGYGLARIFVENYRQWDAQLGYVIAFDHGGLTMGQLLSLPMVAIGIGFLLFAFSRRKGHSA